MSRVFSYLALVAVCAADILAVDIGNQFFKAAVVSPGKFDVVMNQQSKRKTATMVSFAGDIRNFGDEATRDFGRSPARVPSRFRWLIGAGHIEDKSREPSSRFFPYTLTRSPENTSVVFEKSQKTGEDTSAEEALGHVLNFAKSIGEHHTNRPGSLKEAVLTISSEATMRERQAFLAAGKIAGFLKTSLAHETSSAAVQRALDLTSFPSNTLVLNVGSSHTEACMVKFTNSTLGIQANVLACSTAQIGGDKVDVALAQYAAEHFVKKHPKLADAFLKDTRAQLKLLRQAEATKLQLSANKDAQFTVEGLHADIDFSVKVSRAQLESLAADDLVNGIVKVAEDAISKSALEETFSVELIGGAYRIPKVLAALQAKFGEVGQRLNGDEAPVMGAAFSAASESNFVRIASKVTLIDSSRNSYSIDAGKSRQVVIPLGHKFGSKKTVKLPVKRDEDELVITVFENEIGLDVYRIMLKDASTSHFAAEHILLRFELDNSGIFKLNAVEVEVEEPKTETVNKTETPKSTRHPLSFTLNHILTPPLENATVEAMALKLAARVASDAAAHARLAAKNELESYLYSSKEQLENPDVLSHSTEEERNAFLSAILAEEEWFSQAEDTEAEYRRRLVSLKSKFASILHRISETSSRKELGPVAQAAIAEMKSSIEILKTREWVPSAAVAKLESDVDAFSTWFEEALENQAKKSLSEDPFFSAKDVKRKLGVVGKEAKRLLSVKQPKPVVVKNVTVEQNEGEKPPSQEIPDGENKQETKDTNDSPGKEEL